MKDFFKIYSEGSKPGITTIILTTSFTLLLLAMFVVPFVSRPESSITVNTINDLGAQSASLSWIINIILVMLSVCSLFAAWEHYEGLLFHKMILIIFGISLSLMAFFNHSPGDLSMPSNIVEDAWNRYFTGSMILSFIILALSTALILDRNKERVLSFCAGAIMILLTILTDRLDEYAGIWQRLEMLIMFGWMIRMFKNNHI